MPPPKKKIKVESVGGVIVSSRDGYRDWLKSKGVQCLKDDEGFEIADFESLEHDGTYTLGPPLQQQQQQQQTGNQHPQPGSLEVGLSEEVVAKIENSVCVLIENDRNFGSGFAVSKNRMYTAAHHWEEEDDNGTTYFAVKVGDKVECIYGKPSANKRYTLRVVKLDPHLDYCILEQIEGGTFTEFLETDVSPTLRLTTPLFLAAYQIGIQDRLDEYDMKLNLGITTGAIVRRSSRHMVHSCAAFKGDSGGAIVISNGKVIGLHIAAVNEAKEMLDLSAVDFGSVADSINRLCDAQSSGSIALLVSAIEP